MDTQLATLESQKKEISERKQAYIDLLRELVVNGKKLSDTQIMGRAAFAAQQGLDPISEVHTLVDKEGNTMAQTMAINGYRRICQQQVGPGSEISLEFVEMAPDALKKFPNALIGWECRMRVGDDYVSWQKRLLEVGKAMRDAMGGSITYQELLNLVGQPPMYSGVGFIYASELNEWKDRNFNPIERCKKRAELNARKKRFPTNAPIYEAESTSPIEKADAIDGEFSEAPKNGNGNGKHTEAENMTALGFTPDPPKSAAMPRQDVDATTGEINPTPETQPEQADKHEVFDGPDPLFGRWPADAKISYDMAKTVLDSKNKRYVDMPKEKISFVKSALLKRKSENHLTPEELDGVNMKLDILDILNALVEPVI